MLISSNFFYRRFLSQKHLDGFFWPLLSITLVDIVAGRDYFEAVVGNVQDSDQEVFDYMVRYLPRVDLRNGAGNIPNAPER